jgi:hypothetical protein
LREFSFDAHIFRDGETYVAYVLVLDVASGGRPRRKPAGTSATPCVGFWRRAPFVSIDHLTMNVK